MFQLARIQFDFLALRMEPTLTFCTLEHRIVVGYSEPVYKDFFLILAFLEIW